MNFSSSFTVTNFSLLFHRPFLVYCALQIEEMAGIRSVTALGILKIVEQVINDNGWSPNKAAIVMMPGIKDFLGDEEAFKKLNHEDQVAKVKEYIAKEQRPKITLVEGAHR